MIISCFVHIMMKKLYKRTIEYLRRHYRNRNLRNRRSSFVVKDRMITSTNSPHSFRDRSSSTRPSSLFHNLAPRPRPRREQRHLLGSCYYFLLVFPAIGSHPQIRQSYCTKFPEGTTSSTTTTTPVFRMSCLRPATVSFISSAIDCRPPRLLHRIGRPLPRPTKTH